MINALAGGSPTGFVGETGVTRLIDTGTDTVVVPLVRIGPEVLPIVTRIVPVCVPLGRFVGSAVTVRSIPSGGSRPLEGVTCNHGLSTAAANGNVPSGKPGMWTICTTTRELPAGTLTFGFG